MSGCFAEELNKAIVKKKSYICIGLDPNFDGKKKIPDFLLEDNDNNYNEAIYEFNRSIIDSTHKITPVYKPQSAFYEKYNAHNALKKTIDYIHSKGSLAILDAKRNDIGNTSKAYANSIFDNYGADCTTINGYLGWNSIAPFLDFSDKGIFLLVKTSNPSSIEFQDQFVLKGLDLLLNKEQNKESSLNLSKELINIIDQNKLKLKRNFILMAELVHEWSEKWRDISKIKSDYSNIGAVVGATFPDQMKAIRKVIPKSIFLIPGYGAQGGKGEDILSGFNDDGLGAIINSSRGINYAYLNIQNGENFGPDNFSEAAAVAAEIMRLDINTVLKNASKCAF
jgi:orotidine-5'-phosphate decarboxylase